ncbi:hypothetical protein [Aliiroseovarius subalbicans]|uniref:hypothetical protein n=1 Tax=Aliiroseovarius subalbicans TaxID=2925840 RepID=UPI001F59E466|nr:hypothetical protein [Aliiroseovarius subalbicans]MCI2400421.1 hypothetical protein [Aliiroseovarius subalbicans]
MNTKDAPFHLFNILIAGEDHESTRKIGSVVEKSSQFRVVSVLPSKIRSVEGGTKIDAVILDFSKIASPSWDLINDVRANLGDLPIIVVSDKLDEVQTRRLIKLQVHDWLLWPIDDANLMTTINSGIRGARTQLNRVHAVISGNAGAGASIIAASMTDLIVSSFLKKSGETAALFDLDFSTGNCGYMLNMVNSFQLEKVTENPQRIDAEFANLIQKRLRHGYFVYSFKRPELLTDDNGYELVMRMLDAVNVQHEHTVVDIPYYETEWRNDVLAAVNTCTIVTEGNLPALKHTLDTLQLIKSLKGEDFAVQILINKQRRSLFGNRISQRKLVGLFGDTPLAFISRDDNLIEESLDRGILPREISSRSRFLKDLTKYVKGLFEKEKTQK